MDCEGASVDGGRYGSMRARRAEGKWRGLGVVAMKG